MFQVMLVSQHQSVINEISQLRLVSLLNAAYKVYYNTVHKGCTFVQLIFGRPVMSHFPGGGDAFVCCSRGSLLSQIEFFSLTRLKLCSRCVVSTVESSSLYFVRLVSSEPLEYFVALA